jgi:hypothetical protein
MAGPGSAMAGAFTDPDGFACSAAYPIALSDVGGRARTHV